MERKLSKTKFVAVFATTTLIFLIGLYVGHIMTNQKLNTITDIEQDLKFDILDLETQFLILNEDPCKVDYSPLSEELYELGSKLDYMENKMGSDNKNVDALKNFYFLLEIRHWLFIKRGIGECHASKIPIVYFYSNKKDCSECKEQGFILNYIRQKYDEVYIYSFDINLGNNALRTIKNAYNITSTPSLIVGDTPYYSFLTKEQLERIISEQTFINASVENETSQAVA